ncbi:MAG: alpha/beta hydrolase [Promethearchaeota archaeon]|nr:MAG: alpha/beta hydrolase [Candidatus Lokiarchaeota archaeon]
MRFLESGTFEDGKHAYVKLRFRHDIDNTLVIFPPTQELIFPLRINPYLQINRYKSLLPQDELGDVYILGYDPQITVETFLADIAEDFGEFIRERIGPCSIAGISFGGGVAIPFAAKYPELVKKLLLVVSSYAMSEQGLGLCKEVIDYTENNERLKAQVRLTCLVRNPLLKLYLRISTRLNWTKRQPYLNPPSTVVNAYTHMIKYNYGLKKYIHGIKAPTLMIGGTKDQFFSVELYHELADAIENCETVLFKGATHAVPVEKIFKIKKLVKEFLKT